MVGWMCCNQWEKWPQWDDEDNRVARDSLRSQITMLRSHASAFVWANASDGRPPDKVREDYHQILRDLHWQNAVVDTVSSYVTDDKGVRLWDGIQMAGPYTWRPPSYWFSGRYRAARGASAEQGDNEHIPPFASLQEFIPPDKLWPINDYWTSTPVPTPATPPWPTSNWRSTAATAPPAVPTSSPAKPNSHTMNRLAPNSSRIAALGWAGHKMTIYWMLNNHWPSFFGNIFDYYLRPGGAYFGAKKGLRPLSAVFDSYATGDHSQAKVTVVNQTPD